MGSKMIGYLEDGILVHVGEWTEKEKIKTGEVDVIDDDGSVLGKTDIYDDVPIPVPCGWVRHDDLDIVQTEDGGLCLSSDYRKIRKQMYPSVGDQLDALYKAIVALSENQPIPEDANSIFDMIQSVKNQVSKE